MNNNNEEEELSAEIIDDLRIQDENSDEELAMQEQEKRRKRIIRIISLLTIIVFVGTVTGNLLSKYDFPSISFLYRSNILSKDFKIQQYQKAIITIDAQTSKGTGFNIDSAGLVITNNHVIENSKRLYIKFSNGKSYPVVKKVQFPEYDLAIVDIKGENLPILNVDIDSALNKNDEVTIVGNPLGFPRIASKGIVKGSIILNNWEREVLMIEGDVHPGSSGSPVINSNGDVVAVIFATIKNIAEQESITALAVPISYIKEHLLLRE